MSSSSSSSSTSKKRNHSESTTEGSQAECPFIVRYINPADKGRKGAKRRKGQDGKGKGRSKSKNGIEEDEGDEEKARVQNSPFTPSGKFRNDSTLDLHYRVEPWEKWLGMTRYNSFVLNQAKYYSEGFIYVTNGNSAQARSMQEGKRSGRPEEWVARILEIRASDEHHVYARVYWMYWPDEIPPGTKDGNKTIKGRQPYHGANELIASNHMDIINVVSVAQEAKVKQWLEEDDDEVQDALYWRQAFNVQTAQLSTVQRTCKCNEPANPDKFLVKCSAPEGTCGTWLHTECVKHDILTRTYQALGTTTPHQSGIKQEQDADPAGRPLSPPENGTDYEQSIDAKLGGASKEESQDLPSSARAGKTNRRQSSGKGPGRRRSGVNGSAAAAAAAAAPAYEGLFEAEVDLQKTPPVAVIKDLRKGVGGGDATWTERLQCLLCETTIE